MLMDVPAMAEKHIQLARTFSEQIIEPTFDTILERLELPPISKLGDDEDDRQTGLREYKFRIKSPESMQRKFTKAIADLVAQNMDNQGPPSYSPIEAEIIGHVRDAFLRYTLVLDKNTYFSGVKVVEKHLGRAGWSYMAKNYWHYGNDEMHGQTTYMGLSMNLKAPPNPIAFDFPETRYPVELEIHTPESFKIKNENSQQMKEHGAVPSALALSITERSKFQNEVDALKTENKKLRHDLEDSKDESYKEVRRTFRELEDRIAELEKENSNLAAKYGEVSNDNDLNDANSHYDNAPVDYSTAISTYEGESAAL
uniref:Uncharacterized protein n=1 Tax=Octactis speculum TaxID=3111310 RepID=A0A7S2AUQ9_9STRA